MAKKYYAVKVGKTNGIFETWEECKASVDGYPGALYKSFKNLADAHGYMGWSGKQMSLFNMDSFDTNDTTPIQNEEAPDTDIPFSNSVKAVAYVDGSFNSSTNIFGYGVVMFHNGHELHLSNSFDDEEMASMRNVAGEILGSMAAVKKAIELGLKDISIFYDYAGIKAWAVGEWKRNKKGTIEYYNYITSVRDSINIRFVKVRGHSGVEGNEEADRLAKRAVGI